MDIIIETMKALNFTVKGTFKVKCKIDDNRIELVDVEFLSSNENESQAYLVVECENSRLVDFVDGKIVKEIALTYRRHECHKAEMDKNTSLLFVSRCVDEVIDMISKVKIEDDPYYFKKYVFSYSDVGLQNAMEWLEDNKEKGTILSLIQDYVTDTNHFSQYKDNYKNEPTYAYFIELATKLHCFPIKKAESKGLKSVKDYLEEELDELRKKTKNPIDINAEKMEEYMKLDIDFNSAEDVCRNWNALFV